MMMKKGSPVGKSGLFIKGGIKNSKLVLPRKRSGSFAAATTGIGWVISKPAKKHFASYVANKAVDYLPTLGNTKVGQAFKNWTSDVDTKRPYLRYIKRNLKTVVPYLSDDSKGKRYRKYLKRKVVLGIQTVF